jgi:hypothetical protein
MGRLLIEIILIILFSSITFVLGAIVGSGKRRSDEEKALLGRKEIQPGQLIFKNRFSPSA